jgi:aurora kinase
MVEHSEHGYHADIWCLGILTYEFCVGYPPFEDKTQKLVYEKIKNVQINYPSYLSKEAINFMSNLIVR